MRVPLRTAGRPPLGDAETVADAAGAPRTAIVHRPQQVSSPDDLLRLGKELSIPPISTNDSHYNNPEDADAHDALICVASGKRLSDTNRPKFDGGGYYIKSAAEMRQLWADGFGMPEACDNTVAIAERCQVEFTESTGGYMARADVPAGETEDSWFRKEVWRGIEARYPGDRLDQAGRHRVEMELALNSQKGLFGYYLVVADLNH